MRYLLLIAVILSGALTVFTFCLFIANLTKDVVIAFSFFAMFFCMACLLAFSVSVAASDEDFSY